ncbi:MAG: AMP-binding protein [Acidimicrobiales bacterium]
MEASLPEVATFSVLLDSQAATHPERRLLVLPNEEATYGELATQANHFARCLLGLGVNPGDNVGILLPPMVDYVAAMFGVAKIGAVPVLMNARFKARELEHVITNGDLTTILTSSSVADKVDFPDLLVEALPGLGANPAGGPVEVETAPELNHVVLIDDAQRPGFMGRDGFDAAASSADSAEFESRQHRVQVHDVALIMYTSGTTASPKGAMLSHEGLVRQATLAGQARFGLDDEDVMWTPLPMFHIGGMSYILTAITAGCTIVHAGHFDAEVAVRQLIDESCTVALPAFETMWLQILDHADTTPESLEHLRLVLAVGVPERLRMMQDRLPHAAMVTTFGGTEASSHLSIAVADDPPETRLTTGGFPLPGVEVRIVNPETGAGADPGEPGEIVYRGWSRFLGYYNDPEGTAAVIDDDGWFYSGDVGTLDEEGRLTFVSRLKDMLKVGGENVAAAEIEGFLVSHPAINIVQVVSAPDARYTEVAAAFVELKPRQQTSEAEIIDFCRGKIATFKIPRYVRFVDEWPMSGTKIKKFVLRERIARELAEAGTTEAPRLTSS